LDGFGESIERGKLVYQIFFLATGVGADFPAVQSLDKFFLLPTIVIIIAYRYISPLQGGSSGLNPCERRGWVGVLRVKKIVKNIET
jgi:hypothetical protein